MKSRFGPYGIFLLFAAVLPGCVTYTYPNLERSNPQGRYVDQQVVYTSVGSESVVELSIVHKDPPRGYLVLNVYVENLGKRTFDFGPGHVRMILDESFSQGNTDFVWSSVALPINPDSWALAYSRRTSQPLSSTGGFGASLRGATVGEAIVAQNQLLAEAHANRQSRQNTAINARSSLIGITTLMPGDRVSGGIGLGSYSGSIVFIRQFRKDTGTNKYSRVDHGKSEKEYAEQDIAAYFGDPLIKHQIALDYKPSKPQYLMDFLSKKFSSSSTHRYTVLVKTGSDLHVFTPGSGQK